jgi:hypothetical protein
VEFVELPWKPLDWSSANSIGVARNRGRQNMVGDRPGMCKAPFLLYSLRIVVFALHTTFLKLDVYS